MGSFSRITVPCFHDLHWKTSCECDAALESPKLAGMIGLFCFALAVLASPVQVEVTALSRVTASQSDGSPTISERQRPQKNERELGTLELYLKRPIDAELPCGNLILEPRNSARCDLVSGGKTTGFHLAVKRRPREWD